MSTLHMLRALVDQRLTAAVEEIFVVLERTIAEYEAELSRTKEENNQLLDAVFKKHQVVLHRTDVQQPLHIKEEEDYPQPTNIKEEDNDPQPTHIKEEEEDPHMKKEEEGECVVGQKEDDVSKFPLTVAVKTEEHEDKAPESSQLHHSPNVQRVSAGSHEEEWHTSVGQKELQAPSHIKEEQLHDEDEAQSLQLHHSQSEENRGAELVSQHITEADGDSIFAPLSPVKLQDDGANANPRSKEADAEGLVQVLEEIRDFRKDIKEQLNDIKSELTNIKQQITDTEERIEKVEGRIQNMEYVLNNMIKVIHQQENKLLDYEGRS
ncbi:uncharacterized protein [Nerophis lumbriciformis]|uniref:uncharacterized protein n=1 Tax=Nerophis lumbriciformis TaxID=546530 RepID=UPI003BAB48BB